MVTDLAPEDAEHPSRATLKSFGFPPFRLFIPPSQQPSLHFPKLGSLTKYFPPPRFCAILGHRQAQGTFHKRPR